MERRTTAQLVISVASILSVLVSAISVLTFIQVAEKRITTMEIRIENLTDNIKELKLIRGTNGNK